MVAPPVFCLLVLASVFSAVSGCAYIYGTIEEASAAAGGHYTYSFNGLDWLNSFQGCRGTRQSPVLLPAAGAAAATLGQPDAKSTFSYGTLTNGKVLNNGHTLQVVLPAGFTSDVQIPIKGAKANTTSTSIFNSEGQVSTVKALPAQFHFHSHSEHLVSGAEYPLEMHIVHFIKSDQLPSCGKGGCPVVLGLMLALTGKEEEVNPQLRKVIEAMPLNEGDTATIAGDLDVNALLPADKTYFTYDGSLTTPPCTEGVLWHVLSTPIKISQSLLTKYEEAVGDLYCGDKKAKGKDKDDAAVANSGPYFALPPMDKKGCMKLANGHNYRVTQPINGRPIKLAV